MRRALAWGLAAVAASTLPPASADDPPPPDLTAPSVVIERPTERALVIPKPQANPTDPIELVLIEGAAGDNVEMYAVTLTIYDTVGRSTTVLATCDGCGSRVARWSHRVFLPPGSYVAEARGYDPSGNAGVSARRSFFVV